MKPTENIAKSASTPKAGLVATLCAVFHVRGSGAPKTGHGSGASKAGRQLFLSLLVTTLGALAFTTAPALAASGHVFKESFGEACTSAPCGPTQFSDPSGVAVNNVTGDVYVVDKGNSRVVEFNPKGEYIAEFSGDGTAGELAEPEAIAIDNSGETVSEDPSVGDVYVTDHNVVDKFSAEGTYLGQITEAEGTAFTTLDGVAVDPKGFLWVYQGKREKHAIGYVDAYSDAKSNAFLSSRESAVGQPQPGLAVDSEDDVYVAHGNEGEVEIAKLNNKGEVQPPGERIGGEGKTGVAVEPASNNLYIDSGESGTPEIQEFAPDGTEETFGEKQLADRGGTALAVSYANVSSGDVYVVDSAENKVDMFIPPKAIVYAESFSFGSKGTGSGQFTEPLGVAVNDSTNPMVDAQAEDVYVVDMGNKRVEQFEKDGHFIRDFASPPGGFNEPEAIAVDNCKNGLGEPCSTAEDPSVGDVYVTDLLPQGAEVYKFSSTGTYLGQLRRCPEEELANGEMCENVGHPTTGFDFQLTGVAVGPEGNVWVGTGYGFGEAFNEFSDTGAYIESSENPSSWGSAGAGIVAGSSALDPSTGQLFVDKESSIDRYASGEEASTGPAEIFPSTGLQESRGIAVNPVGTVYATERTADDVKAFEEYPLPQVLVGAVSSFRPTSVTLGGSVNPEGAEVSSCEFEYGTTTAYGQIAECEPAAGSLGEGTEPELVGAQVNGLASGTTYHYRLVASNVHGTNVGSDHEIKTPGPSVTEEQVTYVEATSATLQAQIDPYGNATSYHFEYDTSPYTSAAAHGTSVPVPNTALGSGTSAVPVSVRVTDLEPGTVYYYRAVAEGEPLGTPEKFYGASETFTTNPGSVPAQNCPNERLRAEQPFGLTLPDCRAYEMVSPAETDGQDATDPFIRGESNPRAAVSSENPAITYNSKGSFGNPTGAATTNQFLSRRNAQAGRWETQAITPLWNSSETETASSFEATVFTPELTAGIAATDASLTSEAPSIGHGEWGLYVDDFATGSYRYVGLGLVPLGVSTDLGRVLLSTGGSVGEYGSLVEWIDGTDVPVSITNTGAVMTASPGSAHVFAQKGDQDAWHAMSEDGSRVYFTIPQNATNGSGVSENGQLYVRVNIGAKVEPEPEREQSKVTGMGAAERCTEPAKACTIKVSAGTASARYWGASANGEKAFYTENEDLYEYSLPQGQVTGGRTAAITNGGKVQGVVQISEDGSYVYFVADGKLAAGAVEGEPNLYVSHEGGAPVFIATLDQGDGSDWGEGRAYTGPELNTAVVNPSGSRLAFLSKRSLTGYDNQDVNERPTKEEVESGVSPETKVKRYDQEVFVYDAQAGSLVCASCNPTGARPVGPSSLRTGAEPLAQYRPRNLIEDGTLFFDSSDVLVPHAKDGRQNVYEYENGHVYALSDVAGNDESFFLDASASGEDVFFGSADKLLTQDTGDNVVVWDARKDGGFPVSPPAPSCDNADACKPPESAQPSVFAPTGSATFNGLGDFPPPSPTVVKPAVTPKRKTAAEIRAEKLAKALKQCRKEKSKQKRARCEKSARKKYGTVKTRKAKKSATTDRRAGR